MRDSRLVVFSAVLSVLLLATAAFAWQQSSPVPAQSLPPSLAPLIGHEVTVWVERHDGESNLNRTGTLIAADQIGLRVQVENHRYWFPHAHVRLIHERE
ncbi:MAG: hypothetical protein CMJ94_11095 [Planctomycetes bacterium]|nr:hypothetical protein [Planctomycetota bacterium]